MGAKKRLGAHGGAWISQTVRRVWLDTLPISGPLQWLMARLPAQHCLAGLESRSQESHGFPTIASAVWGQCLLKTMTTVNCLGKGSLNATWAQSRA